MWLYLEIDLCSEPLLNKAFLYLSGPISNAWCPYKRKQRHTDRSKTTCDDRGRDSGNVVTGEQPQD